MWTLPTFLEFRLNNAIALCARRFAIPRNNRKVSTLPTHPQPLPRGEKEECERFLWETVQLEVLSPVPLPGGVRGGFFPPKPPRNRYGDCYFGTQTDTDPAGQEKLPQPSSFVVTGSLMCSVIST